MYSNKRKRAADGDESDDDPIQPGSRQLLPIAELPDDFGGEPQDGLQYLFTVRRDARKLPHVTRVVNPYDAPSSSSASTVSNDQQKAFITHPSLPTEEWQKLFHTRFVNLKQNLSQPTIHVSLPTYQKLLPDKRERDSWWAFLAGQPEADWNKFSRQPQESKSKMRAFEEPEQDVLDQCDNIVTQAAVDDLRHESPKETGLTPREPTTTLLRQIDSRMALHILMYFSHWIHKHLSAPGDFPCISETHARWIFMLLTRVDEQLMADDMNTLRNLARAEIALLNQMQRAGTGGQEKGIKAVSCWIAISTVVSGWGQRDLWMDAEQMLRSIE